MNTSNTDIAALAQRVGEALLARGWRLATAESCTGGGIAAALTDIAGSSQWFERGFVTYSNEAKQEMLGVSAATLSRHGAVSEATVREMVMGALAQSRAEMAVAVSGIAGPSGGTADKPVGLVCLAWLVAGTEPVVRTAHFSGDRAAVRAQTVRSALHGVLELLDDQAPA
ncbi:MAG: nicotinamide-nucleotide amidohydrolase family protein [Gammaproteobacteria bacterium]|nr:nicotinamide-nucleotide amidohydrolase family protein [Gammaproteobacteria bacterium]